MGGYAYKHANDMLRAWLSTVHWVNDKLTGENAINLKGCTKEEVNGFACKIMDYLKPMTSLKNFTPLRNFRKAGCDPDNLTTCSMTVRDQQPPKRKRYTWLLEFHADCVKTPANIQS